MTDDSTLLRRYAEERSEDAFTELVRRHLDFVFSVAMREARGDFARAQDITQEVFTALARKASGLHQRKTLVGWLHISAHHAAANLKRSEQRRQRREQQASVMHDHSKSSQSPVDWEQLKPVLNEVVQELGTVDRDALLLRFYQQQPFREIGATLRLSEEAVQKRVERALDKMRTSLTKRGITSTSVALATMLQNNAVVAAPTGLLGTIAQGALTATSAGGGAVFVHLMAIGKTQLMVVAALIVAGVTTITFQHRAGARLGEEIAALQRENQQIVLLRAENQATQAELEGLRAEHAENVRLRGERDALKASLATKEVSAAPALRPEPMRAVDSLHNVGNATPSTALESLIWAKENVDVAMLSRLFVFTPEVRKKVEALFAEVPEDERTKQGITTPEQLVAFYFGAMTAQIANLQQTEQYQIDADNVAIRAVLRLSRGEIANQQFEFHRSPEGWQWVFPSDLAGIPDALRKQNGTKPDSK